MEKIKRIFYRLHYVVDPIPSSDEYENKSGYVLVKRAWAWWLCSPVIIAWLMLTQVWVFIEMVYLYSPNIIITPKRKLTNKQRDIYHYNLNR